MLASKRRLFLLLFVLFLPLLPFTESAAPHAESPSGDKPVMAKYAPSPEELGKAYDRATGLAKAVEGRVFKDKLTPHWFQQDSRFWYRNDNRDGSKEFIVVETERGQKHPAFDHKKLAEALSKAAGKAFQAERLPFTEIDFVEEGKAVRFTVAETIWKCDLASYECVKIGPAKPRGDKRPAPEQAADESESLAPEEKGPMAAQQPGGARRLKNSLSPDRKWTAYVKDHNIFVRGEDGKETQLSKEGVQGNDFQYLHWSPDSKVLVATRVEEGENKEVYRIESSPPESGRPILHRRPYALPGDRLTGYETWLLDPASKTAKKLELERIDMWGPQLPHWNADKRHFTIQKLDRGYQRFRIFEVDAQTAAIRTVFDEKAATFLNTYNTSSSMGFFGQHIDATAEYLWLSERDGWRHLYLIDLKDGQVKHQLTKGEWVVRRVEKVDDQKRQVWFSASGRNPGQDPYLIHHYRVNFDGTGLVALTDGDGNHTVQYAPSRKYLIDTYSQVDKAPVHGLRRAADGKLLCELEKADVAALQEIDWRAPESFHAKGRDGKTDIWGVVYRPRHFDPTKLYPVIEDIYAGPQDSYVPKSFSAYSMRQTLAELGFIVVRIDGMGTANRSKAFHDVCWHNLADAGFPDRILWIKALAAAYPYVDASRVGVYGTSAGGQNAAGALLFHPEFYKAAVASCGCHDNRMDKFIWNEQWMGYPVGPHYAANSNITHAAKLRGKLLLIVGEMDSNVPPATTLRLADAFIKAGKDFDLLMVPGMEHSDGGKYGRRRLRDFFVRHLHGLEPPERNDTARTEE